MLLADFVANRFVGRDRGDDTDNPVARQKPADESDPSDVRVAIFFGKSQADAQVGSDYIAVKNLGLGTAFLQTLQDHVAYRRLAGTGKSSEPESKPLVFHVSPV